MDENRLARSVLTALVEIERFTQTLDRVSNAGAQAPSQVLTLGLEQMLQSVATNLHIATEFIALELDRNDLN